MESLVFPVPWERVSLSGEMHQNDTLYCARYCAFQPFSTHFIYRFDIPSATRYYYTLRNRCF